MCDIMKKLREIQANLLNIEKLKVYNMECKSLVQLYYEIAKKLNEVIDGLDLHKQQIDEIFKGYTDQLDYVLTQGIYEEVARLVEEMLTNGVLENALREILAKIQGTAVVQLAAYENLVVDGVWDEAISQALADIKELGGGVLELDRNDYKLTKELPLLDFNVSIQGKDHGLSKLVYEPAEENTTLIKSLWTNDDVMYPLILDKVTIEQANDIAGTTAIVHAKTSLENPGWGGRIKVTDCRIMGFTKEAIKIYAPFNTLIQNTAIKGNGFARREDNEMLPTKSEIGIHMVGFEDGTIETFGNMNRIDGCLIYEIAYPIRGVDVGSTVISNCTFDPSFVAINFYSNSSTYGYNENVEVNNCWFESYNGQAHPKFAAYCCYKIDESTGDIVEDSRKTNIVLNNCKIDWRDGYSSDDPRMNSKFVYYGNGGYSNSENADIEDTDRTIWRLYNNSNNIVRFGTKENNFRQPTKFKNGLVKESRNGQWGYITEYAMEYHESISATSSAVTVYIDLPAEVQVHQLKDITVYAKLNTTFIKARGTLVDNAVMRDRVTTELFTNDTLGTVDTSHKGITVRWSSGKVCFEICVNNLTTIDLTIDLKCVRI